MRFSSVALFLASALTVVPASPIAIDGIIARGVVGVARDAEVGPVIELKRAPLPTPTGPDWRRAPEPTSVDWRREPDRPDWRREPSPQEGGNPDW